MNALCDGDFTVRADSSAEGLAGELAGVFNQLVARNAHLAGELRRVRHEVVRQGRLDERITASPGQGAWATSVDVANQLVDALAGPVTNATRVLDAIASGDLTRRVDLHDGNRQLRGDLRRLGRGVNRTVDQLSLFTGELTRIAREVGTEGRLGGRAKVQGLSGDWRMVTEAVNTMASRLTAQVRDIAAVTTAVARGDLTRQVTVEATGELLELKLTVNTMVDQLRAFADEVTRVAREVGTEGELGGRAQVRGVSGVWKDSAFADEVTRVAREVGTEGELGGRAQVRGVSGVWKDINTMVDRLSSFADEVTRVAREVGTEGNLGGQAQVRGVSGVWKDLTDNVNFMASNLTSQVRNIAQVTTAVADGDLSKKITVDARGEILELKETVNSMVQQLRSFADEVTRVAREVGTEGQLGGRAGVPGASGVWKDLTDNVNFMASNLTSQVRNIAQVATAVARGDLSKKIDVDARGEILELKTTINTMVDTLSSFSSEVTRVAREVGSEGRLGGQARVEGVYGTWKRLTTGVNELALNLTTQVRAIAEVASAVAQGDMSGSISVEAQGEVAELKNNVNLMVANLRETTRAKDWLESNLARIASLMQGHRDLVEVADLILRELTPLVNAQFGAFFLSAAGAEAGKGLELIAGYGTHQSAAGTDWSATGTDRSAAGGGGPTPGAGTPGRGLVAQAALEKKRILINDVPPDYLTINSGLGSALPASVVILPICYEGQVLGVIELASFSRFSEVHLAFIDQFVNTIGVSINTIIANARTESLLSESQRLTTELRQRSNELQRSNAELEEKAALLATASQYKSEFLANMSHELRTPLNSLLILARLLADNPDGRLSAQEVQFAATIHRSGSDLLQLINDILDLSKIEAGRMDVRPKKLPLVKILDYVNATFRPLAADRGLSLEIAVGEDVPREMFSDEQRLQQILRNLLSNALKFTSSGGVTLRVERAPAARFEEESLRGADAVIAFSVTDTGIGIPPEKLPVIFEAFQQSDGTTSRTYGGTGLGLSISREIAGMLGGRIVAESELGVGSRFTLYVPAHYGGVAPVPGPSDPRATGSTVPAVPPAPDEPLPDTADHAPSGIFGDPDSLVGGPAPGGEDESRDDGRPEATRLKEWQHGRAGQVLDGRRILIVDDDIRNVFALTHVLGRIGMKVKYAENGREGLEALHRDPDVSLVLMDVMMPEMDGYETIRAIRSTPRLADVPILALTAKVMPGDREKAIDSGANGYVPKPVDVDRLISAIVGLLDPAADGAVGETADEAADQAADGAADGASAGAGGRGEGGVGQDVGEGVGDGGAGSGGGARGAAGGAGDGGGAPAETGPPRPRQGER
ncbi:HAMP domain-containing protein [Streptomyces hygroscopicus]|uniref:HAMP domain-containing protein n=1 Tax=Streptomyces hygroscopicus TaxID=1912 RepID=UPI00202F6692|nr:HAMP domain-containing protein [Streptomyces hygroscopicus]